MAKKQKQTTQTSCCMPSPAEQEKWKAESNARILKDAAALTPADKKQAKAKLREDRKAIDRALKGL